MFIFILFIRRRFCAQVDEGTASLKSLCSRWLANQTPLEPCRSSSNCRMIMGECLSTSSVYSILYLQSDQQRVRLQIKSACLVFITGIVTCFDQGSHTSHYLSHLHYWYFGHYICLLMTNRQTLAYNKWVIYYNKSQELYSHDLSLGLLWFLHGSDEKDHQALFMSSFSHPCACLSKNPRLSWSSNEMRPAKLIYCKTGNHSCFCMFADLLVTAVNQRCGVKSVVQCLRRRLESSFLWLYQIFNKKFFDFCLTFAN